MSLRTLWFQSGTVDHRLPIVVSGRKMRCARVRGALGAGVLALAVQVSPSAFAESLHRVEIRPPVAQLPGSPGWFGAGAIVLPNGNVVVADPQYSLDAEGMVGIGLVALYRPDGTLISALRGSHAFDRVSGVDDEVALANIVVLADGDFVVASPLWNGGRGAATWGDGETGWGKDAIVEVSAENSLVGATSGDSVAGNIVPLPNGRFLVRSPSWDHGSAADAGAVTWADADGTTTGVVSPVNSLTGGHAFDFMGGNEIAVLDDGSYVVSSSMWDDGEIRDVGVAVHCPAVDGCIGRAEDNVALRGRQAGDYVGYRVVPIPGGNYVVISPYWRNDERVAVGAATYRNGQSSESTEVTFTNSTHGSRHWDFQSAQVQPLSNGSWVLTLPTWDTSTQEDVGAVAWRRGGSDGHGAIAPENALTGSRLNDGRYLWTLALSNGHYVAGFPFWDDTSGVVEVADAGAVIWGHAEHGITGRVDPSMALVGSSAGDRVGLGGATALNSGDYVVLSPWWDLQEAETRTDAGAATWRSGAEPSTGVVLASNSLHGSSNHDFVNHVFALDNGSYVVLTPSWDDGEAANVGAATWCAPTGCAGPILRENSLTGSMPEDAVGNGGFALRDGNYVVLSWQWSESRGAVTWRPGVGPAPGQVSIANSLVGKTPMGSLGFGANHTSASPDGGYVIQHRDWHHPFEYAGAVILARADGLSTGVLAPEQPDLVSGHSPYSTSHTVWNYGEDAGVLAVGDYLSGVVTLLRREDVIFREGFEGHGPQSP